MIIHYDNEGNIGGTIDGRIHSAVHLNMSMEGFKNLVVQWKPVGYHFTVIEKQIEVGGHEQMDEDGESYWIPELKTVKQKVKVTDFEPDHPQKDIFVELDKNPMKVYDYKVDVNSKLLVLK